MNRNEAIKLLSKALLKDFEKRENEIELWYLMEYEKEYLDSLNINEDLKNSLLKNKQPFSFENPFYDDLILHSIKESFYGVKNEYILSKLKQYEISIDFIEGEEEELYECPCCHYLTLKEQGFYNICKVCYWEEEDVLDENECSACNHMSLKEGRENFKNIGACSENMLKNVDKEGVLKYKKSR